MSWWTDRQDKDPYVKLRDKKQYISRAYFKIQEINDKYYIIKKNSYILDLGAAPGGWSQFFTQYSKNIYAIDILDNFKIEDVNFFVHDVFKNDLFETFPDFDLICSDMAPNMCGNKFIDQANSINLCFRVLEISRFKLRYNGTLVMKTFEGEDFDLLIKDCRSSFGLVKAYKPKSSRVESKELYVICKYFKLNKKNNTSNI
jgi:23S rRNA (uridine2552-2'-O)-methyltransferase